MKTIIKQRYNSTYGFVESNELEKEAEELFGKNWEAEDDVNQIQSLINHLGHRDLLVSFIKGLQEDDILVSKGMTTTISYDDTRDISIRIVEDLLINKHIKEDEEDEDWNFEVQDTIHEEINKVLGLDDEDNFEIKTKKMKATFISYSDFLFSQLFMNYLENNETEYQDLEYDLIFPEVLKHQNLFLNSVFNTDEKGEYDCIIEYLKNEIKINLK